MVSILTDFFFFFLMEENIHKEKPHWRTPDIPQIKFQDHFCHFEQCPYRDKITEYVDFQARVPKLC